MIPGRVRESAISASIRARMSSREARNPSMISSSVPVNLAGSESGQCRFCVPAGNSGHLSSASPQTVTTREKSLSWSRGYRRRPKPGRSMSSCIERVRKIWTPLILSIISSKIRIRCWKNRSIIHLKLSPKLGTTSKNEGIKNSHSKWKIKTGKTRKMVLTIKISRTVSIKPSLDRPKAPKSHS